MPLRRWETAYIPLHDPLFTIVGDDQADHIRLPGYVRLAQELHRNGDYKIEDQEDAKEESGAQQGPEGAEELTDQECEHAQEDGEEEDVVRNDGWEEANWSEASVMCTKGRLDSTSKNGPKKNEDADGVRSGIGRSGCVPHVCNDPCCMRLTDGVEPGGYVYVGKSTDPSKRISQHMQGRGADFTKAHKPTGVILERLGTLEGEGDGPERDETLRQMDKLGVDRVRGWKYCCKTLGRRDRADIESNIREMKVCCCPPCCPVSVYIALHA